MNDHDSPLVANDRVLLTELRDGTGLLLHLGTKVYFTLNETGVVVWKTLASGPTTRARIADALAAQYEAPEDRLREDVASLIDELIRDELVRPGP